MAEVVEKSLGPTLVGFNRREMEDERRRAAEKKATEQRATNPRVIEEAERLVAAWNERQAKRMPMLFSPNDRRRHRGAVLVSVGVLPGVPDHQRDRPADARPPPRRRSDKPHSRAVVPFVPAKCTVRRTHAPIKEEHRRRNARGAPAARAWRVALSLARRSVPFEASLRGDLAPAP
jgi:hypothetical protein